MTEFACLYLSCSDCFDQKIYNFVFVLRLIEVENDLLKNVLTKLKYTEAEEKVRILGDVKYKSKMAHNNLFA